MHTSEWRMEPGSMTTWARVMRGSEKDGDLEIVAKAYSIEGCSAESVANLIAAAPELLAALTDCRDWLVAICDSYKLEETERGYLEAATNAIDKAEGRSE